MANLTDFFATSTSELALPLQSGAIKVANGTSEYASTTSDFWSRIGYVSYEGGTRHLNTNVGGTGWMTVCDQTSGGGYCTHIIFPYHTAGGYECRITVDGVATTYTLPTTVQYYTFMLGSGDTATYEGVSSSANRTGMQYKGPWDNKIGITNKNKAINQGHYLPYETSLKVEVRSLASTGGSWLTGTYQKYAAVLTTPMIGVNR
tara:strand:+ start:704 stop:1315 length:612 start_codon:yes stop_codon:yes gene_type:complete